MKKLILFFALPFLTISCSAYNADSVADIYQIEQINKKVFVWKNDKKLPFEITFNSSQTYISDMFVKNNDVYIMAREVVELGRGEVGIEVKFVCRLWKNGKLLFESSSILPRKIFVNDNNDFYFVGNASIWKNGVETKIKHEQQYGFAQNIFVSNDNVYVVGRDYFDAIIDVNGKVSYLEKDTASSFVSDARSVFVTENNDVYVVGSTRVKDGNNIAVLWKNFEPQYFTDGKSHGRAEDVLVVDTNVYVVGCVANKKGNNVAMLWKNGVAQKLENGENLKAQYIYVVGNDVYVWGYGETFISGFPPKNSFYSKLWKNGKEIELLKKDCFGECRSVFVVAKEKE